MDMDAANSNEDDDNSPLMVDGEGNGQSSWHPRFEAFSAYSPQGSTSTATSTKSSALRIVTRRPLVARLTKDIVDTYWACNPKFSYSEASKPKRFLTNPSNGVLNDGHDNANSDLILSVNFVLVNETQQRYIVKDMLGQGTFGQVAKCWISETNSYVAVKVIKNLPAYYHQALVEVSILTMLNQRFDPEDKHHMVRILDYFVFQQHLCISFEMLGSNLYELIKMNQFRGLSLSIVQMFSKQILHALVIMKDAGIIHCDLKPENILLSTNVKPPEIKIIDFGSACTENRTVYSYIQSRYYRSPEVLLGHPYTTAIDMWSFGCIIAELFLGWPLFPGASEFDLIKRMIEILGTQPPDHMLKASKSTSKFFKCVGGLHCVEDKEIIDRTKTPYQLLTESPYQLLTEDEYEVRELKKPVIGKQYFNYVRLEDIVVNYPYRKNLTKEEINKESLTRLALIDFLRGVIEFDPVKRWSPSQAAGHPFLTGEPYLCSYVPPSETPQITVAQNVVVDHNPGGGHWFQAGLSPQISDGNRYLIPNGLYFPMAPFSLVSSYGSYGSHGSYKDCNLGSSHGSYGDGMYNNFCSIGPSGLNILQAHIGSSFGANPVTRHRASQLPHGPTYGGSSVGKFGAMSLGATPSQFTPPSSQLQISSGSPGKYGSTSPARNNLHGSPLSKVSAFGHYNQKRSWGSSNASHMQPNENVNSQNRHGSYTDGSGFNHPENNYFGHGSPHNFQLASSVPGWTQGCGNYAPGLSSLTIHQNYPGAAPFTSHLPASSTTEAFLENIECTSQPNPGDWDPNYSDDLLLQDDDPDTAALSSGIFNGLHVSKASDSTIVTENIADRRIFNASNQIQRFCGNNSSNRRTNTFQTYCYGERISPPINDKHNAQNILKHPHHMPHYLQSSPSRFSQQPFQQMSYTQGALTTSYCDQMNKLPFASHCNTQGLHSPRINIFANGVSCGHGTNHHPTSSLPPPHSRKDYERIA